MLIRSTAKVVAVAFLAGLAIATVAGSASTGEALVESLVAAVGSAAAWVVLQASRR